MLTLLDVIIGPMSMANLQLMLNLATYSPQLLEFKMMKPPILDLCFAEKFSNYQKSLRSFEVSQNGFCHLFGNVFYLFQLNEIHQQLINLNEMYPNQDNFSNCRKQLV